MIYFIYIVIAIIVVLLSIKASQYVDMLEKSTNLSGAFIGGVMLSAVTSLPEMFTSISSTLLINQPGLCIGNILGSDLFNSGFLAVMLLVAYKAFGKAKVAKSHTAVALTVTFAYLAMLLNMLGIMKFDFLTINITSWIIFILYFIGIKSMSGDNGEGPEDEVEVTLTVKQIVFRFILVSIGIIVSSIGITYVTDMIADALNLGKGLAGALFLGIATSLPELASTITLVRMKNFNIAIGNIVGSNLFNFFILSFVDVLYFGKGIYDFSDPKTVLLLITGMVSAPLMLILLKKKNKFTQLVCPVGMIACYVAFLVL